MAATLNRYTVVRSTSRSYGYAIRDAEPRYQHHDDVEGVGLVVYDPPKRLSSSFGWYKYKYDARAACDALNAAILARAPR